MTAKLSGVAGLLVDLDGTVYQEGRLIPGAAEAIAALRRADLPLAFTTNTTRKPRRALVEELSELGVETRPEEIFTAPRAAASHLAQRGLRRVSLLLAAATFEDFQGFQVVDEGPQAVVVGDLGRGWTYERLNQAFHQLLAGAELVAIQKNRYWKTAGGLALDAGPFIVALEYATGKEATLVGKPSRPFFQAAARALGVDLAAAVMVGDDLESDIRGAQAAGARGVLVRTGKFRQQDLEASQAQPDHVLGSLADLPALLGVG